METPTTSTQDRLQWIGPGGLAELRRQLTCNARDATAFRARARTTESAGMRVVEFQSTELRGQGTGGGDRLSILQLQAGGFHLQGDAGRTEVPLSNLCLLPRGAVYWALAGGTRLRVLQVPADLVPGRLHHSQVSGVLFEDTPLTRGLSDAMTTFTQSALASTAPSDYLGQALRALALAVLEERAGYGSGSAPTLREHIIRYIDSQLSNPGLAPGYIASAFGVSVRWVHKAFNRDGETVALFIRHRRVDAIAEEIRTNPYGAYTQQLAAAYGFSGRDHLNRVFRARYGSTVHEYREAALRSRLAAVNGTWLPDGDGRDEGAAPLIAAG